MVLWLSLAWASEGCDPSRSSELNTMTPTWLHSRMAAHCSKICNFLTQFSPYVHARAPVRPVRARMRACTHALLRIASMQRTACLLDAACRAWGFSPGNGSEGIIWDFIKIASPGERKNPNSNIREAPLRGRRAKRHRDTYWKLQGVPLNSFP